MMKYLLLDLDNTIYSQSCGLWQAIGDRINRFMTDRLEIPHDEVAARRDRYMNEFGTTLNALRRFHGVDPDEFLAFVHDLPLADYLQAEPLLDGMLSRLPFTKVIFTNADALHARRVLARLGVARHFDRIIDIRTLEFVNKPDRRAYMRALQLVEGLAEECIFVDDCPANVMAAKAIGMVGVLVRDGNPNAAAGDYQISRICDLEQIVRDFLTEPRP